jgi:hypothetical protein
MSDSEIEAQLRRDEIALLKSQLVQLQQQVDELQETVLQAIKPPPSRVPEKTQPLPYAARGGTVTMSVGTHWNE